MTDQTLITNLIQNVENIISTVNKEFKPLTINQLNQKENIDKWSILECLEHLNRYHAYYNAAIKKGLAAAKSTTTNKPYKNGWFGKMSIDMMSPDNAKKQKAIAKFNPVGSQLTKETMTKFLTYQQELLTLLEQAKGKNINQRKVPVEFFKLIKMKIGDALDFVITHERRHILQAQAVLKNLA
ncbi:MAG: DinB family protein [Saprospiraceae bacterium]